MYKREKTFELLTADGWTEDEVNQALDEAQRTGEGNLPPRNSRDWVVAYRDDDEGRRLGEYTICARIFLY